MGLKIEKAFSKRLHLELQKDLQKDSIPFLMQHKRQQVNILLVNQNFEKHITISSSSSSVRFSSGSNPC